MTYCLLLCASVNAKTYTNKEYNVSMWLPDEAEIISDGDMGTEYNHCWFMKAEYMGLNISFSAGRGGNPHSGANFNDLGMVNQILNNEK